MPQLANKTQKISQLIQDYIKENSFLDSAKLNSEPPIIQKLKRWLSEEQDTKESIKKLAIILINNYLRPSENIASFAMKIALPDLFKKQELEQFLNTDAFSENKKAYFKKIYLNNIFEIGSQSRLKPTLNFFSQVSSPEIQRIILSNLSSNDLIKTISTSMLTRTINLDILFERNDEQAICFQEKIIEKWVVKLFSEGRISDPFFYSKTNWINRITSYLSRTQTSLTCKIHCALLLEYLWGSDLQTIKSHFAETISKIKALPTPLMDYSHEEFDSSKDLFLRALTIEEEKINLTQPAAINAEQLTINQLAKSCYQSQILLTKESKEDLIHGCKCITIFAALLSPCPHEIIEKLISLVKHKEQSISSAAMWALIKLEPQMLVLQIGILEKLLATHDHTHLPLLFNYLIKLAPLISSTDISENFIFQLIHSKTTNYELKKKALFLMGIKLSTEQLKYYVHCCLEHKLIAEQIRCLTAVPAYMLRGKLVRFVDEYKKQLNNIDDKIQYQAIQALPSLEPILDLFPDNFLPDFIHRLKNTRDLINQFPYLNLEFCKTIPKIIHLIKEKAIEDVYETLLQAISGEPELREAAFECINLLAPRLSPNSIKRVEKELIKNLDCVYSETSVFGALTKIANRFKDDELIKILIKKSNLFTFKYLPELVNLISQDSIDNLLKPLFDALNSVCHLKGYEACISLIKIAEQSSFANGVIRKIIPQFIDSLAKQKTDVANGYEIFILYGLIKFHDLIAIDEFKELLNLPAYSFERLGVWHVLETFYERKCQLALDYPNLSHL